MKSSRIALVLALIPALSLFAGDVLAARTSKAPPPKVVDQAAVDGIYGQLRQAGERYQLAQVQLEEGDDGSLVVMNTAIEDMEDIANQCFQTPGCDPLKVVAAYEVLLKQHDLGPAAADMGSTAAASQSPILQGVPAAQATLQMLGGGQQFEQLVENNPAIQAAIAKWLTSQRSFLIDAWENYQFMRYLMWPEYQRAGLPEALLFGMMAKESGGKVHSISRAGASGPLQFMYATGLRFGLNRYSGFDSRFDPAASTRANASYMKERFAELNRNLEMAIAAYNGGEGRALRISRTAPNSSFWSPEIYSQWPVETRDYVPAVIAAAWLFQHPEKYGLKFPKIDTTPDQFAVARGTSLNELTICLGNAGSRDGWFRALRNLNPSYEPETYISQGTLLRAPRRVANHYRNRCVQGELAEMAGKLVHLQPMPVLASPQVAMAQARPVAKPRESSSVHRVQRGDSLMAIAREHDCDLAELARANELKAPGYRIHPGQRIKLKGCQG